MKKKTRKFDKEYIESVNKKIWGVLNDEKEYDDWMQICFSMKDAVKKQLTYGGCLQMKKYVNSSISLEVWSTKKLKTSRHLILSLKRKGNDMKKYRVMIELDIFETMVSAKNKTEAKRKAIEKLQKKEISTLIRRGWPDNKKQIFIDEE